MLWSTFVWALLTAVAIGDDRPTDLTDKIGIARAYQRGLAWVLDQQAADGGWHSETYGIMRGGAGNTAQVVWALSHRPGPWSEREDEAYQRGLVFLTSHLDEFGLVRGSESVADFPVPATALTLTAIANRPPRTNSPARQKMIDGLIRAQRRSGKVGGMDDRGWGGWGMFADSGVTNLSATAQALAALNATGSLTPEVRDNALAYLARMQHGETIDGDSGGFFFTPQPDHPLNKAGWVENSDGTIRARATVSSTCDGLAALLACGVPADDRRAVAARNWLIRAAMADGQVSADGSVTRLDFRRGLEFYEAAAWSRIWTVIDDPRIADQRRKIVASLVRQQSPDGFWQNSHPSMREDDPLIATAFALSVLGPELIIDPKP
ncbi:MAG: terpene cyclase/mutase family protein [Planctomycetaceae bacterium]|nr:terpene cyclase/mutase family protein [Planctomycetaceae bacterium]